LVAVLETIHLVLDRSRAGDPRALVYVAEPLGGAQRVPIATSPVFRPDLDITAHRAALAQLESDLRAEGWQREATRQDALIGVRFHRLRGDQDP
jgi:hypothetical protein